MKLLQSIFGQPKPQCIKCGKIQGETPFNNRTDKVCFVCRHYSTPKKFTCCKTIIDLHHGEPEMCPDCGKEIISFGASVTTGSPHLTASEVQGKYIVEVYHHRDGHKKYLQRKLGQAEKIKDENIKNKYINFYRMTCRMAISLSKEDRRYYRR